jgi:hypothetical protein
MSLGTHLSEPGHAIPIPRLTTALVLAMVCSIGARGPVAAGPAAPIDARR